MEVDAPPQRDRRDGNWFVARDRAGAPDGLRLGVQVLHHVDVGEGVDLRRDRVTEPVPRLVLRPRAVDLREVDLGAPDEGGVGFNVRHPGAGYVDEVGRSRLERRGRAAAGPGDQHPRHCRAVERRRDFRELVGMLVTEYQRDLQRGAGSTGDLLRGGQCLGPPRRIETHLGAQVGRAERAQQLALAVVGHVRVAVLAEPDRRHAGPGRRADGQVDRAAAARPSRGRRPA